MHESGPIWYKKHAFTLAGSVKPVAVKYMSNRSNYISHLVPTVVVSPYTKASPLNDANGVVDDDIICKPVFDVFNVIGSVISSRVFIFSSNSDVSPSSGIQRLIWSC